MDDNNVVQFGQTKDDKCPLDELIVLAQELGAIVDSLEEVNASDHRDRFFSLAITDLQSAQNWLARWFNDNVADDV